LSNGNNGNGEVKKLVELKHTFKAETSQLEADLRAKFAQELEAAEKALKDKYLEQVVDWFYGNGFNDKPPQPPEEEPATAEVPPHDVPETEVTTPAPQPDSESTESTKSTTPSGPTCPNCGATLDSGANFCSQCASPIEDQETEQAVAATPVATAGRLMRPGYVPRFTQPPRHVRDVAQTPRRVREATEQRPTADERVRSWARTQRR
jgi:hypothetical protein